ncbi:MAG: DUF885 domain-containing protein [Clostridiales bacterium]|nr:DUF885 domain-containing protein [Clostridiales bacterium]
MPFKISRSRKTLRVVLLLCFTLLSGISIGYFSNHVFSENARFEKFTEELFEKEVSGSALTFHYSVAHPEKAGLKRPEPTLGTVNTDMEKTYALCREYEDTLRSFAYSRLSRENQITLDMLLLYFHTQASLGDNYLLEEMLSPSLGIQAQLPVLLAEYAFYEDRDVSDYLNLLSSIEPYFESILSFQRKKSEAGYFMSDATLERICSQCESFIKNPAPNYMLEIFDTKLAQYGKFSEKDQEKLIQGLQELKGTGKNSQGLAHFPGGQDYYTYLLKSQVGTYVPVEKIRQRLTEQLLSDTKTIQLMLKEQPSLASKFMENTIFPDMKPQEMMETLEGQIQKDFPELSDISYEIRYVHKSLEEYLSPAFYLTPPVDTKSPNVIYINNAGNSQRLDLFTTLSHEGFPGHLYQTMFFAEENKNPIRSLIESGGYIEGWATYVEPFAYGYSASLIEDDAAKDIGTIAWLNRSVNLNICCLMDIGIHYYGWSREQAASFLRVFGISPKTAAEVYQYVVETPANYLKYYWGYLNFLDLRKAEEKRLGENFSLKEFHKKVLEIGAVPFPVLEKYIK